MMKRLLASGFAALACVLLFSGCKDSKSDEVALRVAAFTYAFEHDVETAENQTGWIFTIESDVRQDDVAQALSSYPLAKGVIKIEEREMMHLVDLNSGKRLAHWTVSISRTNQDEAWAEVGCVKGGLNGYGQVLVLKKQWGRWSVVSSIPTWVS